MCLCPSLELSDILATRRSQAIHFQEAGKDERGGAFTLMAGYNVNDNTTYWKQNRRCNETVFKLPCTVYVCKNIYTPVQNRRIVQCNQNSWVTMNQFLFIYCNHKEKWNVYIFIACDNEYWLLYLLQFRGDVYSGKLLASIPQAQPDCRDSGSSVPSALHCVGSRLDGGAALPEVAGEGASISISYARWWDDSWKLRLRTI